MRADNRGRQRRLLSIAEADPKSVEGELALTRCVGAAYNDGTGQADEPTLLKQLVKAYHAFGLDTPEGRERLAKAAGGTGG